MLKKNILQKSNFLLPIYIFSWFLLQFLLSKLFVIYANRFASQDMVKASEVINLTNAILFWKSISGISFKILIEIVVTTILVYIGFLIVRKKAEFGIILSTIILANCIFLIQMIAEYLYAFINLRNIKNIQFETFSLFSVSYFLNQFQFRMPKAFDYAFQVVSFFEILYVLILTWLLKKMFEIQLVDSFKIILISYIFPLTTWLLLITLLSLI